MDVVEARLHPFGVLASWIWIRPNEEPQGQPRLLHTLPRNFGEPTSRPSTSDDQQASRIRERRGDIRLPSRPRHAIQSNSKNKPSVRHDGSWNRHLQIQRGNERLAKFQQENTATTGNVLRDTAARSKHDHGLDTRLHLSLWQRLQSCLLQPLYPFWVP